MSAHWVCVQLTGGLAPISKVGGAIRLRHTVGWASFITTPSVHLGSTTTITGFDNLRWTPLPSFIHRME